MVYFVLFIGQLGTEHMDPTPSKIVNCTFGYPTDIRWTLQKLIQKSLVKWSREARRGSSHVLPLDINCKANRKRSFFHPPGETLLLYYPAGGRNHLSLPSNSPANEKLSQLSQWEAFIL